MNNNKDAGQNLIDELLGGINTGDSPTYTVGATYQADAFHIADALAHDIKLPPTGSFTCSHVGEDGCCWSKDAKYVGDDGGDPRVKGVGWMCAPLYALERGAVTLVTQ